MRVAVIGAGRFGLEHIRAYRAIGAELVGVADPDPGRADAGAALAGTPAYASIDELLPRAAPDAVSVVVPAALRRGVVERLADDGLAVLVEKPLAAHTAEARTLAERYAGRPVMTGHLLRFAEPYRRIRDAVPDPVRISTGRRRDAAHRDAYPGEDVVGLTLVHDLDAIGWLAGPRTWRVRAQGERDRGRWVAVRAELASEGVTAIATAEWTGTADEAQDFLAVEGSTGEQTLRLTPAEAGPVYDAALREELAHFLACAAAGTASDILDLAGSATTVALADAVREALERGGAVDV